MNPPRGPDATRHLLLATTNRMGFKWPEGGDVLKQLAGYMAERMTEETLDVPAGVEDCAHQFREVYETVWFFINGQAFIWSLYEQILAVKTTDVPVPWRHALFQFFQELMVGYHGSLHWPEAIREVGSGENILPELQRVMDEHAIIQPLGLNAEQVYLGMMGRFVAPIRSTACTYMQECLKIALPLMRERERGLDERAIVEALAGSHGREAAMVSAAWMLPLIVRACHRLVWILCDHIDRHGEEYDAAVCGMVQLHSGGEE